MSPSNQSGARWRDWPGLQSFSQHHLDDSARCHSDYAAEKHQEADKSALYVNCSEQPPKNDDEEAKRKYVDKTLKVSPDETKSQFPLGTSARHPRSKPAEDPNLVTWAGPDDLENPKNWSLAQKWVWTAILASFTLISSISSSIVAPALMTIAEDFEITTKVEQQLVLSIMVLAYAFGPLLFGPLSEVYGRVVVLHFSNMMYLVFTVACGVSKRKSQLIAFRFLAGFGASAPFSIGSGSLGDCWRTNERGLAVSIYSLAPFLGPAIAPIAGGFITEYASWRWIFHATSIAIALLQFVALLCLRETYAPRLLQLKAMKIRQRTGNEALHTEYENSKHTLSSHLKLSLIRPFKLLGTQIIVQTLAVYVAYLFGLQYLVVSTFPGLWTNRYHFSVSIGGLNYISIAVGYCIGTQLCASINSRLYTRFQRRNDDVGRPEFRLPLMIPFSLLVPCGLFFYGWSAQYHTHWIFPNIAIAIVASGIIIPFQCIQIYLIDTYTHYAASAIAATVVLRSLAGFAFPLFAPSMYAALDYGWANSLLGFVAVGVGLPAPVLLWVYGEKLRAKSPYSAAVV